MKNEIKNLPTPMQLFGIECGNGWLELIIPIAEYIEKYNKENPENEYPMCFTQIKEKWGGLRVSVNYGTKELFDMISNAEAESYNICETCGSKEDVGEKFDGWYKTMCYECFLKMVKERNYPIRFTRNSDKRTYLIHPDGKEEDITDDLKKYGYDVENCTNSTNLSQD